MSIIVVTISTECNNSQLMARFQSEFQLLQVLTVNNRPNIKMGRTIKPKFVPSHEFCAFVISIIGMRAQKMPKFMTVWYFPA